MGPGRSVAILNPATLLIGPPATVPRETQSASIIMFALFAVKTIEKNGDYYIFLIKPVISASLRRA